MKLFQKLIVAPATLGLLAPLSATANEITISDFNPTEEIAITNSRIDGLEARFNNIEAGSFSETTSASFKVNMAIGAVDGKGISAGVTEGTEQVGFQYSFQTKLKSSFTGEDELSIAIDSGTNDNAVGEFAGMDKPADQLKVDGVAYKFPIGDSITAMVADNKDGSSMFTTACAYGGPSDTLDDCGNVNAAFGKLGFMTGAEYDFDNGLTAAVGFAGPETAIATDASADAYGVNAAYTDDNYGLSVTYAMVDSTVTSGNVTTADGEVDTYTAFNAYYSFDNGVSLSGGYEFGDLGGEADTVDGVINYFLGVSAPAGPGELGAAFGTYGGQTEGSTEELMYEAYYSYPVNDGMTITPLVYVKEKATVGTPDQTGIMVKTSFSF